jgi:hypothetical protein
MRTNRNAYVARSRVFIPGRPSKCECEKHVAGESVIQRTPILPSEPDLIFERKAHFSEVRETAVGDDDGLG